jgi:hypothetical protein
MRRRAGAVEPHHAARKISGARAMLSYMAALDAHASAGLRSRIERADATGLRRIAANHVPHPAARLALRALDESQPSLRSAITPSERPPPGTSRRVA